MQNTEISEHPKVFKTLSLLCTKFNTAQNSVCLVFLLFMPKTSTYITRSAIHCFIDILTKKYGMKILIKNHCMCRDRLCWDNLKKGISHITVSDIIPDSELSLSKIKSFKQKHTFAFSQCKENNDDKIWRLTFYISSCHLYLPQASQSTLSYLHHNTSDNIKPSQTHF